MDISGSVALVTGAHGGIGRAFVAELLKRDVAKVYVTARDTVSLSDLQSDGDKRLVALALDISDPTQIVNAAMVASDVTLLINNAGYASFQGAIAAREMTAARHEMEVNYFGPLALTRAFREILGSSGGGAIVNMLSMAALVSLPAMGTYSASKAAFLSVTRSIRAELAVQGTIVIGIVAVQTETAMGIRLPPPRMQPDEVASDALSAVQSGKSEEIVAGSLTRGAYQAFTDDPKAFQAKMLLRLPLPS